MKTVKNNKIAFTLSEVLITLAVIGIVASLTLPNLIADHTKKTYVASHKKVQLVINNTLSLMNTDRVLTTYNSTEEFVDGLSEYLKIVKRCNKKELKNCFAENIQIYYGNFWAQKSLEVATSASFFGKNWGTNVEGIVLADGVSMILSYNPNCTKRNEQNCMTAYYDVNSKTKGNILLENDMEHSDIGYYNLVP